MRKSAKQWFREALECSEADLDTVIRNARQEFFNLSSKLLTHVLMGRFELGLAEAFARLERIGYDLSSRSLNVKWLSNFSAARKHCTDLANGFRFAPLRLRDFELVLRFWEFLDEEVQTIFAQWFREYWQSSRGEAELRGDSSASGDSYLKAVQKFRPMWTAGSNPTAKQKLSSATACGLLHGACGSWEDDVGRLLRLLLDTYVDTGDDASPLLLELSGKGLLSPDLLSQHPELIPSVAAIPELEAWLVGKMLVGEVALPAQERPQPTNALHLLKIFARHVPADLTVQIVRHLTTFLTDLLGQLGVATNAMNQGLACVADLVFALRGKYRDQVLHAASGCYLVDRQSSRAAQVPSTSCPAPFSRPLRVEYVFANFLEQVLDRTLELPQPLENESKDEDEASSRPMNLEGFHRWISSFPSLSMTIGLEEKFYRWTMAQLQREQDVRTLVPFLENSVCKACPLTHVQEIWLCMVERANSWSFLLHSSAALLRHYRSTGSTTCLPEKVEESPMEELVYNRLLQQLDCEVKPNLEQAEAVYARLAGCWPQRFVEKFGIRAYLGVKRVPLESMLDGFPLVSRKAGRLSETPKQINDAFRADREFVAVLSKYPDIAKTKTKDDWVLVSAWVHDIDAHLLGDDSIAERMGQLLCSVWGDRSACQNLCGVFVYRLLRALPSSSTVTGPQFVDKQRMPDSKVIIDHLVKFSLKCPNLGQSKKQFLLSQFRNLRKHPPMLAELHPLLAAHAATANDLTDFVSELGLGDLDYEPTERLFYDLLAADRPRGSASGGDSASGFEVLREADCSSVATPAVAPAPSTFDQVLALKSCGFGTRAALEREMREEREACEAEWDWSQLEAAENFVAQRKADAVDLSYEPAGAAADLGTLSIDQSVDSFYQRYGPRGEALFIDFLKVVQPSQLCKVLADDKKFCRLCIGLVLREWQPSECPSGQEEKLIQLVTEVLPDLWSECAPLVLRNLVKWTSKGLKRGGSSSEVGEELGMEQPSEHADELATRLLRGRVPDLNALSERWWRCVDMSKLRAKESDILRLLGAGIAIHPQDLGGASAFVKLQQETQAALLEAHFENVEVLAQFGPRFEGPCLRYLGQIFELLERVAARSALLRLGDGVEEQEKLISGWNKILNVCLCAVRDRIREDENWLHTDEQKKLYTACVGPRLDGSNSALLADFMESKFVDSQHIRDLVHFVLSPAGAGFKKIVHDSALRAMVRLETADRDKLISYLLEQAGEDKLPVQVLFSLSVTSLRAEVLPLVRKQLSMLTSKEWNKILTLICEANPAKEGAKMHTFPRGALAGDFNERFLWLYLRCYGEGKGAADVRLFHLFKVCTKPQKMAGYVLDVLARELHPFSALFMEATTSLTTAEFRKLIEHVEAPYGWKDSSRWEWVMRMVWGASDAAPGGPGGAAEATSAAEVAETRRDRLRAMLALWGRSVFGSSDRNALLKRALGWGGSESCCGAEKHALLRDKEMRKSLWEAFERLASQDLSDADKRDLWIAFFTTSWSIGEPQSIEERLAEFSQALQGVLDKAPLTRSHVKTLGVDLAAQKLLVRMVPDVAISTHGLAILFKEPAFAKNMTDAQFKRVEGLKPSDDKQWPLYRKLVVEVDPDRALQLAIDLLKHSRETQDIALLKLAYCNAEPFARKQAQLRSQLAPIWKKFGAQIQQEVIDAALDVETGTAVQQFFTPAFGDGPSSAAKDTDAG